MNPPSFDFTELRSLLDALCEETITAEQMGRLEELVLSRPEAEAYYVQHLSQYADLLAHFGSMPAAAARSLGDRVGQSELQSPAPALAMTTPSGVRRIRRRRGWGALALAGVAAALFFAVTHWRGPQFDPPPVVPSLEATDDSVAVLLQAPQAVWERSDVPTRPGAPLAPGWLRLKTGLAHIEFYCGARIILEGPAELQLISRTEAFCARGKLRAHVPAQAQGFKISSPRATIVDRGTEFGLDVGAGDNIEVHVFQGKVELHSKPVEAKAPPRELTTGQSVRVEGAEKINPIQSNSAGFAGTQQLVERALAENKLRQFTWQAASDLLRKDPSVLVYFPFQPEDLWTRTLLDHAGQRKQPRDGAIVGCTWTNGRWPGKQGLEFKRVSDRVRFHVPGEFDSITLAGWVRIDALPNLTNSLMMTDGWDPGGLHWQIRNDGTIILGVQSQPKGKGAHYRALEAITPERFAQWIHLAVVYDKDEGEVRHYVDGRPVANLPIEFEIPLTIGDVELGNWNLAMHRNRNPIRFFSGAMDEFMLFARALAEQEIERLALSGRPES